MKPLYYKEIKPINGSKRSVIEINLHDDYKNGHADFHVYRWFEKLVFGEWKQIYSPNLPKFREYADIIEMDGRNSEGQPSYAVENGMYHLKEDLKKGADYLGISMDQAKNLCLSDKEYFKYQLFATGIVSEWREKAKKAISHLETLCGQSFVDYENPVVLKLTDEEIAKVSANIANGYYTADKIAERERKAEEDKRKDERAKLIARYDDEIRKTNFQKVVMLAVFDYFGTTDNVILYTHNNELNFGWQNTYGVNTHHRQYTEKEIQQFRRDCDVVGMFSLTLTLNDGETRKAV